MGHVQLGAVRTWYAEYGDGDPLVLLHPGGADSRAFEPNIEALASAFHVFTPDRRGHGRTPDVDGPISYGLMAQDTAAFIETVVGGPAHVVGCSDGSVVGLHTALARPDLVRQVVLVAGVFHHDGWLPGAIYLDEESARFLRAYYGEVSPDGVEHFDVVQAKLDVMHEAEPTLTAADLATLTARTLVMVGDDDEVRLEHAVELYRGLPAGELAVVPGTSHGLMVEKSDLVNGLILDFLTKPPTPTLAPVRRAGSL